jgi:hypothetical protein
MTAFVKPCAVVRPVGFGFASLIAPNVQRAPKVAAPTL